MSFVTRRRVARARQRTVDRRGGIGDPLDSLVTRDGRRRLDRPALERDHRTPELAGVRDLGERSPGAPDRDHRIGRGDDREVARDPGGGGDHVGAVGVGVPGVGAGKDPDHRPAGLGRAASDRLHHPTQPAADHHRVRRGQRPADLGRRPCKPIVRRAGADHGDLPPSGHGLAGRRSAATRLMIDSISSSAPALWSGSFRLPHFGLWIQEGQPASQGHSPTSLAASATRRSNSS